MAEIRFAHIGLGDAVCVNHVIAIIQQGSVTAKRYQENAKRIKRYIDATHGKTIKSFILLDEGTVIASHISVATLQRRMTFGRETDTGLDDPPPAYVYREDEEDEDDELSDGEEEEEDALEGLSERD